MVFEEDFKSFIQENIGVNELIKRYDDHEVSKSQLVDGLSDIIFDVFFCADGK